MYLHLGQETVVNTRDIIGLFDLDTASVSSRTRQYLSWAQRAGQVVNVSEELPKSFIVTGEGGQRVYISQLASQTIKKRIENSR